MAAGTVHIPWYATLFRGNDFAAALAEIAPTALRYGARDYHVYRSRDDGYKFLHAISFDSKADWERFWLGPEMRDFREEYSGWYQVPVLYVWQDVVASGRSELLEPVEQEQPQV
jgi:hypothetical protein